MKMRQNCRMSKYDEVLEILTANNKVGLGVASSEHSQ